MPGVVIESGDADRGTDPRDSDAVAIFATGVIHQLRNQLTVIRNCAHTLKQISGELPESGRQGVKSALELAGTAVANAFDIASTFADFAWSTSSGVRVVDLDLTLERMKSLVGYRFLRLDIPVQLELGKVPPLELEETAVNELLLRIFGHAVHGLPAKSALQVSSRVEKGEVTVSFRGLPGRSSEDAPLPASSSAEPASDLRPLEEAARRCGARLEVGDLGPEFVIHVCFLSVQRGGP